MGVEKIIIIILICCLNTIFEIVANAQTTTINKDNMLEILSHDRKIRPRDYNKTKEKVWCEFDEIEIAFIETTNQMIETLIPDEGYCPISLEEDQFEYPFLSEESVTLF